MLCILFYFIYFYCLSYVTNAYRMPHNSWICYSYCATHPPTNTKDIVPGTYVVGFAKLHNNIVQYAGQILSLEFSKKNMDLVFWPHGMFYIIQLLLYTKKFFVDRENSIGFEHFLFALFALSNVS